MHLDSLPDPTRKALQRVQTVPLISKYTLIGGTALALQARHRLSEDLDFVTLNGRLDRDEIRTIIDVVSEGNTPTLITSAAAREDMEMAGLDIDDNHQDWLVNGVKITFFAPDAPPQRAVYADTITHPCGHVNVLDEGGIFRLKSMVIMDRRTSRDLFDLWFFVDQRSRTVDDILNAMDHRASHRNLDDLLKMIAPGSIQLRDPGFATSMPGAPKTTEELLAAMDKIVAAHRRLVASREIQKLTKGPNDRIVNPVIGKDAGRDR